MVGSKDGPTVTNGALTMLAYVELSVAVVIIWGASLFGYAAAASRAGDLLKKPKAQRALNRCSACTMLGVAGTIAVRDQDGNADFGSCPNAAL